MTGTMRTLALAATCAWVGLASACTAGAPASSEVDVTAEPATASSTPAPAAADCVWEDRKGELEAVADRNADLEPAVGMQDWVWTCVDDSWDVSVDTAFGADDPSRIDAQVLDLVAPDGTHVLLYPLRGDVIVQLVEADPAARLAWTARMGEGDTHQVVEVDLSTGAATEEWGGGAVPSSGVRDGAIYDAGPLLTLRDGTEVWATRHHMGDVTGLFEYAGDGAFAPIPGADLIEEMRDDGSVNRWGDDAVSIWVAPNTQWAAVLGQRQVGARPHASSELGRWIAIDLESGDTRASTSPLPSTLCGPAAGVALQGSFEEPGGIPARCWTADGDDYAATLSLTEAPVAS